MRALRCLNASHYDNIENAKEEDIKFVIERSKRNGFTRIDIWEK